MILNTKTAVVKQKNSEADFFLTISFGLKRGGKKIRIAKAGRKIVIGNGGPAKKDGGFENQKKRSDESEDKKNDEDKSFFRGHWLIIRESVVSYEL